MYQITFPESLGQIHICLPRPGPVFATSDPLYYQGPQDKENGLSPGLWRRVVRPGVGSQKQGAEVFRWPLVLLAQEKPVDSLQGYSRNTWKWSWLFFPSRAPQEKADYLATSCVLLLHSQCGSGQDTRVPWRFSGLVSQEKECWSPLSVFVEPAWSFLAAISFSLKRRVQTIKSLRTFLALNNNSRVGAKVFSKGFLLFLFYLPLCRSSQGLGP